MRTICFTSLIVQMETGPEEKGLDQHCTRNQSVVEIVLEVKVPAVWFYPIYYIVNIISNTHRLLNVLQITFKCFICNISKLYYIDLESEAERNHSDLL